MQSLSKVGTGVARPEPPAPTIRPMPAEVEIVLATGNPHKVAEISAIFAHFVEPLIRVRGLPSLPGYPFPEPAETGSTFEENAMIKAVAYARAIDRLCLADDSGLEVDALDGRPGVISSHFATGGVETGIDRAARDAANTDRLLADLAAIPPARRAARYVCVMVLADASGVRATSRGTFEGRIGTPPRVPAGGHGFGYDPVFLVGPSFTKTGAELTPDEKSRSSHRAVACGRMAEHLARLFGAGPAR